MDPEGGILAVPTRGACPADGASEQLTQLLADCGAAVQRLVDVSALEVDAGTQQVATN